MITTLELISTLLTLGAAAIPAIQWMVNRKVAQSDPRQFPIHVSGDDTGMMDAACLELEAEHWSVTRAPEQARDGAVRVIVTSGSPGLLDALTRGVSEGLILTTGRVSVPAGRWNLANSLVTLSPRLVELCAARLRRQKARK